MVTVYNIDIEKLRDSKHGIMLKLWISTGLRNNRAKYLWKVEQEDLSTHQIDGHTTTEKALHIMKELDLPIASIVHSP
jgi:hypothetical protein